MNTSDVHASVLQSWTLYDATLALNFFLYLIAPVALFIWRWPFAAGLTMALSTLLPIAGQTWFTDSDAPGLGFLLMLEAPLAAIVFLIGLTMSVTARIQQFRSRNTPT